MTRAGPSHGFDTPMGWRGLPYLALAIGLVFATAPTWWMMVFGVEVELDLLLTLRCAAWLSFQRGIRTLRFAVDAPTHRCCPLRDRDGDGGDRSSRDPIEMEAIFPIVPIPPSRTF